MALAMRSLTFDCHDPGAVAAFWSGLLGWGASSTGNGEWVIVPADDTGFDLRFAPSEEPKRGQNWTHFDLTSKSLADQEVRVERALKLGGDHCDVGQRGDEGHVVLADPEGNEFCVIEPGNSFLAECGLIGALASDGSQAVGYFWSEALGWPLVWDQDEETAIRSPLGGPKITWGGPPVNPKLGKNRLHFDLAADDMAAEVERLRSLGATLADIGQRDVPWTVMADPDGNEFCVHSASAL